MKKADSRTRPVVHWRVGELARLTGLTVRTLHHYEQIGLMAPASRNESGHRVYDEAAVQRLYLVRALRSLGVPLPEILKFVDAEASSTAILKEHLARVERQVEALTALGDRLRRICKSPRSRATSDELLATLELMSRLQRHVDVRRARERERPARTSEANWRALGDALRTCMDAGLDPGAARVQRLAKGARTLLRAFAGDDPAVLEALEHLRTADPPASLAGWTPELMAYLNEALRALDGEKKRH